MQRNRLTAALMASLTSIPTLSVCADEINITAAYIQARTDKPSAGALLGFSYDSKSWGGVYLDYLNIDNIEFIDKNNVEQKNSLPAYLVGYQYTVPLNQKLSVAFKLGAAIANQEIADSTQTWLKPGDTALNYAATMNWAVSDLLSLNIGLNRIQGMDYFGDISSLQLGVSYRFTFAEKTDKVVRGEISKPAPLAITNEIEANNRKPVEAEKVTIQTLQQQPTPSAVSKPQMPASATSAIPAQTTTTLVEQRMAERKAQGQAETQPKELTEKIETNVQKRSELGEYKIQLGAFSNPANAKQLANKMENAGYQTQVVQKDSLNLVYAVGFTSRNAADTARTAIEDKFAIKGIVRAN